MTVIVTGGAGFIGSALVRALVADGIHVVTVDKLTYAGNLDNLSAVDGAANHSFVEADICDAPAMQSVMQEYQPETVYHLAAESHVDRSIEGAAEFAVTNVLGTVVLLEAATAYWKDLPDNVADMFRFLMVSTDEVFGELGAEGLFSESSSYQPNSPYAASKAGADHMVRAWFRTHGLPVLISNCSNNFGPFQFPEKLIPLTILNALEGRHLPIYGKGENIRDWIHVDDHISALRRVVEAGAIGETYLVGSRCERRNIDLIEEICAILDELKPSGAPHSRLIEFVADRPGHDARYAIDPRRMETELGWRPGRAFSDSLRSTIEWYLEHTDWCMRASNCYDRGRLGLRDSSLSPNKHGLEK